MQDPPVPFDLVRMWLGEAPPLFYLEILVRTFVVYLYTLLLIRWVGGRGVAQLSMVEFLLVIALGSAVGDSLFYPEVPLLHALAVITLVVLINKGLDLLILHCMPAKTAIDGSPVALVQDGRILPEGLKRRQIGPLEAMQLLRIEGVRNLGQVDCAYMEASGAISVFLREKPLPGLPLVPPPECLPEARIDSPAEAPGGIVCCAACGAAAAADAVVPDGACPACGRDGDWRPRL